MSTPTHPSTPSSRRPSASGRAAGEDDPGITVIHDPVDDDTRSTRSTGSTGRTEGTGERLWRVTWPLLRIAMGLIFLWAFLDKTFALGFSTGRGPDGAVHVLGAKAWVKGASPTAGYLTNAPTGPFADLYRDMAGHAVVDWLFMLGMLGVGLALLLGLGLRIAAVCGVALMLLIRATFALPENNPVVDEHLVYVLVLVLLAVEPAAARWSLAGPWRRSGLVRRCPVLR